MAEETSLLKSVELRLLRCTISYSPSPHQPSISHPLIEFLVDSIERGQYADALASPEAARLVFGFLDDWAFDGSIHGAALFYDEVEKNVERFLRHDSETWLQVLDAGGRDAEVQYRYALVLCLGVAALLAFIQQNVTGPVQDFSPFPLPIPRLKGEGFNNGGGEWDAWARAQLTSVGCDLLVKFPLLQYIVYAKVLLSKASDLSKEVMNFCQSGCRTLSWWLCRLIFLQQRISDELSSSLYDLLQVLKSDTLLHFGKQENIMAYWGSISCIEEALTIASMAHLEAGILEYKYGRVDSSRLHLNFAEEACGLHLFLTGALGFRTVHQVDAKAQMVLVTDANQQNHGTESSIELTQAQSADSAFENNGDSHTDGIYDCSDILMRPRLVENFNVGEENGNVCGIGKGVPLTATQQAVILAQCLHLRRRSRADELSRWEMAPYIEAIDAQHRSYPIIGAFCNFLRIQWESTRSRTIQRALLMMDKLVEGVNKASHEVARRIQFSFGVYVPTIPALQKEYGELLVRCGLTGEALKIFEDLELWDSLIYCYCLLGKKSAAVVLIKARLLEMPNEAGLWCSLGDVTNDDACYEKALEASSGRSVRAKRSLARSSYNRGDYEKSKILWEAAMAQNSLYSDGWFALGAAALKARDTDKALDAFTRAVQLDPENGEAWNNIACLHMVKKRSREAFVAFKEALKFKRGSWQLWENYSKVAFDIGNYSQALEAVKMVLELSTTEHIDVELLDRITWIVEEKSFNHSAPSDVSPLLDSVPENQREVNFLADMLGSILQQAIRSGGSGDIWGLYARWHKMKGNLTMCSEALLKQVRSYQGSDLWHNVERFRKFAKASLQLCQVYMEIASSAGSNKELFMAEMHLRNTLKQAVDFSETKEFKDLQSCLDEIRKQLSAVSA